MNEMRSGYIGDEKNVVDILHTAKYQREEKKHRRSSANKKGVFRFTSPTNDLKILHTKIIHVAIWVLDICVLLSVSAQQNVNGGKCVSVYT